MERNDEVANAGLLRPPWLHLGAIAIGVALEAIWPTALIRSVPASLGTVLVVVGAAVFVASLGRFRAAGTTVRGDHPATAIVRTGPYRVSRNPIYLSFFVLHAGIAVVTGSAWVLATLAPVAAVIAGVVVPREEHYLERRFGQPYADYRASVRRWL